MARRVSEIRAFWRQFRREYRTTGSVLPSSRWLARSLARHVGSGEAGQRVLEVGPGTGAVTSVIVERLRDEDRLDVVEINAAFVEHLEERFASEKPFRGAAGRLKIFHSPVEQLDPDEPYDLMISGLPLNNFTAPEVEAILEGFARLLRPGGTLSFFGYIAIRNVKSVLSGSDTRRRLREVGTVLGKALQQGEFRRDWVWPNVPPAWVHHLRRGAGERTWDAGAAAQRA